MFDMASFGIIVSCLVSSLILEAKSEKFVTVHCQKSEIVAQYGTSTILECVVQDHKSDAPVIEFVSWNLNNKNVLTFDDEATEPTPGFQFAVGRTWNRSNVNVSLLITDTNLSHAGDYSCYVMTDSGNDKSNMHLTVKSNYSKPVIGKDPEEIKPDKDFTLTCRAHGGFPKGYIRWVVNDVEWIKQPVVVASETSNGLYNLTSKLSIGPNSQFSKFVCEVYTAAGVKQGQETFDFVHLGQIIDSEEAKGKSVAKIVAPVVVIGSLIVGLLVAVLLMCRRKQQNVPPVHSEEIVRMV